jgi:dienelactone hydrolase
MLAPVIMRASSEARKSAMRKCAASIALAALAACTTHVPLSDSYRGPDAWPTDGSIVYQDLATEPLDITAEADVEARIRAHFVVRQVSLPPASDSAEPIEFEYYDVDGDARTPVVVLLPIFNGQLKIPRFFARYFANQGWAAVVVTRGRNPLDALMAPESAVLGNLQDYHRVLDWVELEPELDATRIGVLGVSLGAMDAVMLTALDHRVNSLVIAMAGGDLSYLLANTNYRRVVRTIDGMAADLGTSRAALGAKLDAAIKLDPLAVAPYVDAERVFMVLTRRDAIIPFEAQEQLRETMGSPEALYLMTGHRPSVVFFPKMRSAAFQFFERRFELDTIALAVN